MSRSCLSLFVCLSLATCSLAFAQEASKPLPAYRLGPDGRNATPQPKPDQPIVPRTFELLRVDAAPDACALTSPPEYAPVHAVLLRYRSGDFNGVVTDIVANLTGPVARDERAYVVVSSASQQSTAETEFAAAGADLSKVDFFIAPNDSVWMRDYGPHFIWQGGAEAIVDSHYYPQRTRDNFIPTVLADDEWVSPSYDIPLYYSGGNFQASADRRGFITALAFSDNPDLTENEIAELYGEYQGIDTLHVFPQLPGSVDGTGHIDMWMYLVDEDSVIISEFLPGENPDAIQITNEAAVFMEGLGYTVHRTPAFNDSHPFGSAHYTYTNAFRVNDRIFVSTFGDGNPAYTTYDNQALAAWEAAAGPGVEIVPIPSYDIIWASGAIHCIVKQVPRYEGPDPAACTTAPRGGELVGAGTLREITWTATDDDAVASIDLLYSVDGGATYPPEQTIAAGIPDIGAFDWSVPLVESAAARVKVVARDGFGGVVEAESEADFSIESALRSVYDFTSGAGSTRRVFGSSVGNWGDVDRVRMPVTTELTGPNYAQIALSDATGGDSDPNRYISPTPSFFGRSAHVVEIEVGEDPATITDIELLVEGYADSCAQLEAYVWDTLSGQWCDGAGNCGANRHMDNFAGNRDEELRAAIRSDFSRYVDSSTGVISFLLFVERTFSETFLDYVSLAVTHDPCPGTDLDFDGFADACDNCVAALNPTQEDQDADTFGDACDCAPADAGAFAIPAEIAGVRFLNDGSLAWDSAADSAGTGTVYDVLRDYSFDETCAGSDVSDTTLGPLPDPAPGSVDTYLVRGQNTCGAGGYGSSSGGSERTSSTCP